MATPLVPAFPGVDARRGMRMGHIIGRDISHPSWLAQYEGRYSAYGISELANLDATIFASGNSLDEFLFVPGDDVPSSFLCNRTLEAEVGVGTQYYPGVTPASVGCSGIEIHSRQPPALPNS